MQYAAEITAIFASKRALFKVVKLFLFINFFNNITLFISKWKLLCTVWRGPREI